MSDPLIDAEVKYYADQHYEEVVCRSCKECGDDLRRVLLWRYPM